MRRRKEGTTETRRHRGFEWFLFAKLVIYVLFALLVVSCEKADRAKAPEIIRTKTGIEMVLIPAGQFEMGTDGGNANESPVHKVWIDSFLMDRFEVTQEQYVSLAGSNPSHFRGDRNPVDTITWADAALYCNSRSRAEGLQPCYDENTAECDFQANGYRLPTEAEWEYACRAGTDKERFFGSDERKLRNYAWYAENSLERTHPVGQKQPNAFGLYDIYGNVAEWCNDVYSEDYYKVSSPRNPRGPDEGDLQVLRGGAWNSKADDCRSAWRKGEEFGFVDACIAQDSMGFRCVRRRPSLVGWVRSAKWGYSPKIRLVYQITYELLNPLTQLLIQPCRLGTQHIVEGRV